MSWLLSHHEVSLLFFLQQTNMGQPSADHCKDALLRVLHLHWPFPDEDFILKSPFLVCGITQCILMPSSLSLYTHLLITSSILHHMSPSAHPAATAIALLEKLDWVHNMFWLLVTVLLSEDEDKTIKSSSAHKWCKRSPSRVASELFLFKTHARALDNGRTLVSCWL